MQYQYIDGCNSPHELNNVEEVIESLMDDAAYKKLSWSPRSRAPKPISRMLKSPPAALLTEQRVLGQRGCLGKLTVSG
jgi:hypothetical protein